MHDHLLLATGIAGVVEGQLRGSFGLDLRQRDKGCPIRIGKWTDGIFFCEGFGNGSWGDRPSVVRTLLTQLQHSGGLGKGSEWRLWAYVQTVILDIVCFIGFLIGISFSERDVVRTEMDALRFLYSGCSYVTKHGVGSKIRSWSITESSIRI